MNDKPRLTATQEDYLETIFYLMQKSGIARNKDIADRLDVKRATVTGAVKQLVQKGLVSHETHGYIVLTDAGVEIATMVIKGHHLFTRFFHNILGLDATEAEDIACQLEHIVVGDAFVRFEALVDSIEQCNCPAKFKLSEEE